LKTEIGFFNCNFIVWEKEMAEKKLSRRDFMKIAGTMGIGSVGVSVAGLSRASEKVQPKDHNSPVVPTRPFGRTGENVSILSFGGSHNLTSKQLLMKKALELGVTYWDTALTYRNSEEAMGKYFMKYPEDRKKVFLVTKTSSSSPAKMTKNLNTSLKRLKTSYLDMFFIHMVSDVKKELTRETRKWVEKEKKKGTIRFFGFSTHRNMETCLMDGAKLGWVEGIMTSYNYRLMHIDSMKKAVDACAKAGIGLTAMKTQATFISRFYADVGSETDTALGFTEHFMEKGFTIEQAKLKAVWENSNIASICSEMPNLTILMANAAAAADKVKLDSHGMNLLKQYAEKTASCYCGGCADICEGSLRFGVPIFDVMRHLMYANSYGDTSRAIKFFRKMPEKTRNLLVTEDYSKAEKACPNKMPIANLMKEASAFFV
jgi:predicted aldo/keto reductase-like oxidoreductase